MENFRWPDLLKIFLICNILDGSLKPTIPTTNIGLLVTFEERAPCSSLSEEKFEVFVFFWYWWLIFWWTWLCVCKVCWLWCGWCWFSKKGPDCRFLFVQPQCRASVCPVSGNVSKLSVLKTGILPDKFVSNSKQGSNVVRPGRIEEVLLVASNPWFPLKPENNFIQLLESSPNGKKPIMSPIMADCGMDNVKCGNLWEAAAFNAHLQKIISSPQRVNLEFSNSSLRSQHHSRCRWIP